MHATTARTSRVFIGALVLLASACGSFATPAASSAPQWLGQQSDPTPLAKCRVAANSESPLVTEWPASEKANLQSLTATQTVAVAYSGCELRVVEACQLPGSYTWRRTTLATDTIEIDDADELYAKLPIGAFGLEGELERSGRLAVRTTVAGQLRSAERIASAPASAACAEATHYVSAVSIGAFQLLSGQEAEGGAQATLGPAAAGGKSRRREMVLREAGRRDSCSSSSEEAPSPECASPIQVFLSPLDAAPRAAKPDDAPVADASEDRRAAINLVFPRAPSADEVWTLRRPGGRVVCTVPCDAWVGPVSGLFLQREPRHGAKSVVLHLPHSFPHPPGSRVIAEYQTERGSPTLARLSFYGAIPIGATGLGLTIWGIIQAVRTCEADATGDRGCFPPGGFLITAGTMNLLMAGAGIWWHLYSQEERFDTREDLSTVPASASNLQLSIGPGGIRGKF